MQLASQGENLTTASELDKKCQPLSEGMSKAIIFLFLTALIAIVINETGAWIFEKLVNFEKYHSKNEESMGLFNKIVILQFIDTALANLIVN